MREVPNYELVLSGNDEEKLLLTFSWEDLPHIPNEVTSVSYDHKLRAFKVAFEDSARWEEVIFPNLPTSLETLVSGFDTIHIIGLSDKVELFCESPLEHSNKNESLSS